MYFGWYRFGETEIVNNQRVTDYVRNGLRPVGAIIADCSDCEDLADITGDGEYQTPALDDAPWYSWRDHDSADFAGVMGIEVTGTADSTTSVEIIEKIGDGAMVGAVRASSKVIAVTADLVGRTPESTALGMEWLSAALHPECAEGSEDLGQTLELFSGCPVACIGQTRQDDPVGTVVFDDLSFFNLNLATLLLGPVYLPVCDDVTVEWVVRAPSGTRMVTPATATAAGEVREVGEPVEVGTSNTTVTQRVSATPDFPDDWRPALQVSGGALTVVSAAFTHKPLMTLEECVQPYRRHFRNVVTVDGPKVVERRTLGDTTEGSTVSRVEWTWVATQPHVWHEPVPLLSVDSISGTPTYHAPGVSLGAPSTVTFNATKCPRPAVSVKTCADNPNATAIVLPPTAPVLSDPSIMDLSGSSLTRRAFEIPEDLSPLGLGAMTWVFENDDKPKFGIRVRIWVDTDPTSAPEALCQWVDEFTVDYLAPDQTLYVDGPASRVYAECERDEFNRPVYAAASKNLRGNYGGPFAHPVIGCGRPYYVVVDVPQTYTNAALSGFPNGTSQGELAWSVSMTRRG